MMFLSNIIRGGQLSLHAIRMFRQVFYILMLWVFFSGMVFFGAKLYKETGKELWLATTDYYLAKVLDVVGLKGSRISTVYGGQRRSLQANTILTLVFFGERRSELEQKIREAAVFAGILSLGIGILVAAYFVYRGIKKKEDTFQRGAKPQDFGSIRWEIRKYNRKHSYDAYTIAGIPYPARAETQHSLVVGTTGTGKTALISDVVDQIRKRGDRAIIYDTKGCYLEWFYKKERDYILNPFDKRSEKWNLLKEIKKESHIKSIANAFIPEGKGSSGIWNEAGRIAFSGVIEKLFHSNKNITNRGIADLIMRQDIREIIKLLKGTYAQSIIDPKAPETAGGVLFTMSSYLNNLKLMNSKKSESFSIKEWCKESSNSFLFITSNQEALSEIVPLQTVWWEIVFNGLLTTERNTGQKTWIILDEIGSLQGIPSLQETMSKTREYGCCFVLGMQDIGQLEEIYGPRQSRTISTLCNTRCVFRTPDPYTASWLSKNIGDQELEQVKEGLSYGSHQMRDGINVTRHIVTKPLVMPSEIQNLKDLELYLQLPNYPFMKTNIEWKERDIKSKAFIESEDLIGGTRAGSPAVKKNKNDKSEGEKEKSKKQDLEGCEIEKKEKAILEPKKDREECDVELVDAEKFEL